jgi:hypothetical protein
MDEFFGICNCSWAVWGVLQERFKLAEAPEEIKVEIRQKNDPIVWELFSHCFG